MRTTCNICGNPWHPASGHYISPRTVWCGPCTRAWVKELVGIQKRRWGGLRFYEHATPLPPASTTVYRFHVDSFTPKPGEKPGVFVGMHFDVEGVTVEEAFLKVRDQIPPGRRVWMWHEWH